MNKIRLNAKYRTRDGREVVIFTTDSPSQTCPIVGAIRKDDGAWSNRNWDSSGRCFEIGERNPKADLVEVREPREFWVNIYSDGRNVGLHPSKEAADMVSGPGRVECIHLREVLEP